MSAGLGTKKKRKSIVFLGISICIVISWIIFAKKSEKSDELIHSSPLRHERDPIRAILKNSCAHLFCRCMITGSSKKTRIEYDISSKPVRWEEVLTLNEKLGFGKPSFELGVHGLPCRNIDGSISCCSTRLLIRPGTSDIKVFKHIFKDGEYSFLYDLKYQPRMILDAGANCGFASILFALLFPKAKIVALEPSPDNFQALIQNVDMASLNSRIEAKKIGLWYRTSYLSLQMKGKDIKDMNQESAKWSVRVSETRDKTATVGMSIDRIKVDSAYNEFDYVKIDIEGAENEVFGRGKLNWLSHVRLLSIEMHDKHVAGVTQMIINIIAKSLLHNLRTRPIPCAEYYVWFSPDVYDSELGSNTCFVNGTTRAVLNSKLKGH